VDNLSVYKLAMKHNVFDQRYDRGVSETPPGAFPSDPGQHWGPAPRAAQPATFGRPARWPAFTALVVAIIALAVGLIGLFRPAPRSNQTPPGPTYTAQQTADAKQKVCTAYGKLDRAVGVLNALPKSSDTLVTALNTRQVFDVFSRYLLETLSQEPATPADLAAAVRKEASSLEEAVIDYQDGYSNSDAEMRSAVEANTTAAETIRQLCK
jgi:hypothetical protein